MPSAVNKERTLATAEALDGMAEALEQRAQRIKRRAETMRRRVDLDERVERFRHSWRHVMRMIDGGLSFEDAVSATAARLNAPESTIIHHWEQRKRQSKTVSLWQRDREIMRLAAAGYTNREIADRLAKLGWHSPSRPGQPMHPGSISRVIKRRLGR
jgi:ATP/maltotriose-dependent transcriptional regulator MalT